MAAGVRKIAALPDPVGEVIDGSTLANGLQLRRVRVPLGVIAVVYEARPNVTIDAAALCLKSGNAVVLRGSSSAAHSNAVLAAVAADAATRGRPAPARPVADRRRRSRRSWPSWPPRPASSTSSSRAGGEGLKAALKGVATVPVIYAASATTTSIVDAGADLDTARGDRAQRQAAAAGDLQRRREAARPCRRGRPVPARTCSARCATPGSRCTATAAPARPRRASASTPPPTRTGTPSTWRWRWPSRVVDSVEDAIAHINAHGSGHSEAILTPSTASARAFQLGVDAACVYVNASTRFTDGGEFGMGAEIGNSTQKLHARGPIGLRELCTFKYLVEGAGHVRA